MKLRANIESRLTVQLSVTFVISAVGLIAAPMPVYGQGDRAQAIDLPLLGHIFEVVGKCSRYSPKGEVEQMRRLADEQPDQRDYLLRRLGRGLRHPGNAWWCEAEMKRIR